MTCTCGHSDHAWTQPTVCKNISCPCEMFVEASPDDIVIREWDSYIQTMNTLKEKVMWVLMNLKFTRNLRNKQFIDFFREKVTDADPESIIRVKRKLVEQNRTQFGPIDCPEMVQQQAFKQLGIKEWATLK